MKGEDNMVASFLFGILTVGINHSNEYWEKRGTNLIDATVNFWLGR